MPSFGGVNIFGTAVTMTTTDNPRENQLNAFFGLNGLESLDGGLRGRVTNVSGLIYSTPSATLGSLEFLFRSYNDGVARVLVDTLGTSWMNVRLESFTPIGRVRQSPFGILFRSYQARFLHLE